MSRGVGRTCMSPSWSTSTLLPGREYSTPSLPTLGTGSCRGHADWHSQRLRHTGICKTGKMRKGNRPRGGRVGRAGGL